MFEVIAIVVIFLLFCSRGFILDRLKYRLPPGPQPMPLLGSLKVMGNVTKKTGIKQQWKRFIHMSKTYGKIMTVYIGQYRMVVLQDADLIHEALVNNPQVFSGRPSLVMEEPHGIGIGNANGENWRNRRRFVMRSMREFGMGRANIVEKIHDECSFLVHEIDKRCGKPFVPHHLLANVVSNIICSIVFGKRFDYESKFFKLLLQTTSDFFSTHPSSDAINLIFPALQYVRVSKMQKLQLDILKLVEEMMEQSVAEHRKTYSPDHIRDFADLYIDSETKGEDSLTLKEFSRCMLDMFLAGTETTATAMNWTMVWLCKHPETQKRCNDAIDSVMGASDRFPTLEDRPELAYIDAVMFEALRHPTVGPQSVLHATSEDTKLRGYDIPAKTLIYPNVYQAHHDESYWKDPYVFNPDRWIDENGKLINHGNHFIPFGSGPRVCLGDSLARVEYFIFIVSLLQRFTFSFAPGEDVDIDGGFAGLAYVPQHYHIIAQRRG